MADEVQPGSETTEESTDQTKPVESTGDSGARFTQADLDRAISKAHDRWQSDKDAAVEAERKRLEDERLREKGEFEALFQDRDRELQELKTQVQRAQFRADAIDALNGLGMSDYAEIVIPGSETVDQVKERAQALYDKEQARIEAEIQRRLDTGSSSKPSGGNGSANTKPLKEWTVDEKVTYIAEHGRAAFEELLQKG